MEPAFLSRLFAILERPCQVQTDNEVYHLDYKEPLNWNAFQEEVVARSEAKERTGCEVSRPGAEIATSTPRSRSYADSTLISLSDCRVSPDFEWEISSDLS